VTGELRVVNGGCLCGAVRFQVSGPLRGVVNCHCEMCLKLHGGPGAHSKAKKAALKFTNEQGLKWYRSSDIAERGFCKECGSSLFWRPDQQDTIGILAGALEQPSSLQTIGHIFVSEKPDFYEITDKCPQFQTSSKGQIADDYK